MAANTREVAKHRNDVGWEMEIKQAANAHDEPVK